MNSTINLTTDSEGKISTPVELKYLYNSYNWVSITTKINGKNIDGVYNQLLKAGESKSSKNVLLEDATLKLNFVVRK